LHQFRIIHFDIKPLNLGWSSALDKMILYDYGLTAQVISKIGEAELYTFRGTYIYCSDEMKKIRSDDNLGYVDCYYNDFYGLEKSINELKQKNRIKDINKVIR
jgi:serine/threonine protein kinase